MTNRTVTISIPGDGSAPAISMDPPAPAPAGQLDARQALQLIALNPSLDEATRRAIAKSALDQNDQNEDSFRHDSPLEVVIAATCHEANRQYCRSLGDYSQPAWKDAPGDIQATSIELVRDVMAGVVNSPEQSHERWMAAKLNAGWTYGPQKDYAAKTHPSLVEYAKLPAVERQKDALNFAIVTALLNAPAAALTSPAELESRRNYHLVQAAELSRANGVELFWTELGVASLVATATDQRETLARLFAEAETNAIAYVVEKYPPFPEPQADPLLVPNPSDAIDTPDAPG